MHRRHLILGTFCVGLWVALIVIRLGDLDRATGPAHPPGRLASMTVQWPLEGQAAMTAVGEGSLGSTPNARPVPIASLAKIMTAYLVLARNPIVGAEDGFTVRLHAADVADTRERAATDQSVLSVRSGEVLTERQLLQGLLVASANNFAGVLAVHASGDVASFVASMNRMAGKLGLTNTSYTDPSGFEQTTVSTAADQLRLLRIALRNRTFAEIVGLRSVELPVAGRVHNTNPLLGHEGVIGGKTGSDDAAGGCLAFAAVRTIHGRRVELVGVVLGQPGADLIGAAASSANAMIRSATAH